MIANRPSSIRTEAYTLFAQVADAYGISNTILQLQDKRRPGLELTKTSDKDEMHADALYAQFMPLLITFTPRPGIAYSCV